ncbi:MAG: LppX_LprAFG lipoprotein [Acidimicrobiia bacterium]|nr:LppX_LprAFG lipoprotein [Acidimicrobiia bacterium]NNL70150.1 LppX_LprAFG lipoprotein [Acidimicrobiia bacterium]
MVRWVVLVVVVALVAAGCGDDDADDTTTTTLPSADEVLAEAALTMEGVDSLRFEMELSGTPITLLGVELRSARGQYAAPESSRAILEAAIGGLTIELGTIAIGGTSWVTNPLTGDWEEYTGSRAFNPAIMFDPELGWRPLLTTDIRDTRLIEPAAEGVYTVAGTAAASRVEVLTAGLVEGQPVDVEIDVDRESGVVTRMDFVTSDEAGLTTWMLRLSEFGSDVTIEPPEVD